jgi:hypothetical protein
MVLRLKNNEDHMALIGEGRPRRVQLIVICPAGPVGIVGGHHRAGVRLGVITGAGHGRRGPDAVVAVECDRRRQAPGTAVTDRSRAG